MKVWVFVEGESDRLALKALWDLWTRDLHAAGWGMRVVPLDGKSRFLKKIGVRAAEKLVEDDRDIVVGLPDLYPNQPYRGGSLQHSDLADLQHLQKRLTEDALSHPFQVQNPDPLMERFFPSALKHDLEVLLLAAAPQLRSRLKTPDHLGSWRHPPEEQNQDRPPKRIVGSLFHNKLRRAYRDTIDGPAILKRATNREVVFGDGPVQCPVFREVLDWVGQKTGVVGYSP